MNELVKLINRLKKININIELIGNYPWIYLDKINGKKVFEKYEAEHGFTIGFSPIRNGENFKFTDLKIIYDYEKY